MANAIDKLFNDANLVEKIKRRLPHLFHYAERDSSRAGKIGMEVGSLRERILVSLLIHKFGRENVQTELPITAHDVDVLVEGDQVSIKSITTPTTRIGPVKVIWTVDAEKAKAFGNSFKPTSGYLIPHIVWGQEGGLYYIPVADQIAVFKRMGRDAYLTLPKAGTNPRGVEISAPSMQELIIQPGTRKIGINWQRPEGTYDSFARWIEYWRLD